MFDGVHIPNFGPSVDARTLAELAVLQRLTSISRSSSHLRYDFRSGPELAHQYRRAWVIRSI